MKRRGFLLTGIGVLAVSLWPMLLWAENPKKEFPMSLPDDTWKKRLSPESYRVLRQHGTERAFTSDLNEEKRVGMYYCAGCQKPLFSSETKYNSGTGWPSFYAPVSPEAVGEATDHKIGVARTEIHCAHCGGHLGHVFDDGPKPTGKRYCMNGVALSFKPVE
jgi:peptide-methionine (R)-S-oxide reductase